MRAVGCGGGVWPRRVGAIFGAAGLGPGVRCLGFTDGVRVLVRVCHSLHAVCDVRLDAGAGHLCVWGLAGSGLRVNPKPWLGSGGVR